ncbi:MAG: type II secretion system secretin GspD [Gammaproteobacteria bacterium]|nr:type II secretion system secretin GspD [Gammaproteobacteria bacterium]MBT8094973.1 type II secretion system secretin GspD [Gammaproteobacteria bacterium]NNF49032.1 type II secretion system secretin GspD [Woeseiaceae bacterium]NNL62523.1 type II secretion system secretin GspD [Woeseiaceae bacterium]
MRLLILTILLCVTAGATAQQEPAATLNWKDADIRQVVEAVSAVTGKNFILDPRVTGRVTLLSPTPLGPDALYEAFLSILQVHSYVAIESGDLIKIIPDATARQFPSRIGTTGAAGPDDLATQVVQLRNVGATQLVPILRPLIPQYGHLVAHSGSNMLIISDRAANVARLVSIIRRIDQASDEDVEVVTLEHASAAEIVRILTALTQRGDGVPVTTSLVADARTNSVLIGGDKTERLRLRTLIAHLDTPLEAGGDTRVRYLRYADAEELSAKLQTHFSGQAQAAGGQAAGALALNEVSVWADTQTNAIVVSAPPKMMRSLMQIVDKIDIRREQVLVEAIIVEVTLDQKNELGTSVAVADTTGQNSPLAVTNFPDFLSGVLQLGSAAGGDVVNPTGLIGEGATIGVGRITDDGVSFAAILRAIQGDADTNIISTPSVVTTDNEEATLNVGQEVPFVTGSFTNTGTGTAGAVNPFQTIQRQQVGVKLSITPQINEGDSMVLDISQEISSIAQSAAGAVDLITNQRIVETTVIVDDGEILVLGGLLEDQLRESDQRVPLLGRIPLLGNLFRARTTEKVKTNLMIFIRPTILRDAASAAIETNQKYNLIRDLQIGRQGSGVQLMPGEERPTLPPLEELLNEADEGGM